ncbi:thyrostimulin alpha-2 subunit [Anabrus simplex]|uniref:thyrostimulin alpha-2 subunit n=1 Tax=Anabrus simplex TaxID=316456 RepID=UPI0035A38C0C
MTSACCRVQCCALLLALGVLLSMLSRVGARDPWERPGCHKIGHSRKISIPDCIEFDITTNACRGYCESWAVPSALNTLRVNPHQAITSVGQCCNMMETEDVEVRVMCLDGTRDLVFKSAKSCSCYHCKKD